MLSPGPSVLFGVSMMLYVLLVLLSCLVLYFVFSSFLSASSCCDSLVTVLCVVLPLVLRFCVGDFCCCCLLVSLSLLFFLLFSCPVSCRCLALKYILCLSRFLTFLFYIYRVVLCCIILSCGGSHASLGVVLCCLDLSFSSCFCLVLLLHFLAVSCLCVFCLVRSWKHTLVLC